MKCGTYSKPYQVTPVASQVIVRLITDVQCSTSAVARSRQRNHSKTNGNSFLQRYHRPYNSTDEGSNCTALFNCTVLQLYCTVQLYRTPTVLHSQRIHRTAQRQSELSSYTSNYTTPSRLLTAPCYDCAITRTDCTMLCYNCTILRLVPGQCPRNGGLETPPPHHRS